MITAGGKTMGTTTNAESREGWHQVSADEARGQTFAMRHTPETGDVYWIRDTPVTPITIEKTITLDALKGAIFSATDENGYAQELGEAIWNRL